MIAAEAGPEDWLDGDLLSRIRRQLAKEAGPVTPERVALALRNSGKVLGTSAVLELVERLSAQLAGAGPLQRLLDDARVTDVFVNGPREVWFDGGRGLEAAGISLGSEGEVRRLAVRLAAAGGRRLDDASPYVDVRLPDGVRLNAVIPPISGEHTVLSLRVPRRTAFTLDDFVQSGALPAPWRDVLGAIIDRRVNFLISGGTGAGKTALLGAMLSLVPPQERIVVVEDSAELVLHHPHHVRLLARHRNIEGAGEVTQTDLVRNALRMRPDRLVIGECRGAEVRELFTALNTGHEGGCGTVHANAAADVPARLEALGTLAGLNREAVAAQACSALDVVIHLRRRGSGRSIDEIAVLEPDRDGRMRIVSALRREDPPGGGAAADPRGRSALRRLTGLGANAAFGGEEPGPRTAAHEPAHSAGALRRSAAPIGGL